MLKPLPSFKILPSICPAEVATPHKKLFVIKSLIFALKIIVKVCEKAIVSLKKLYFQL